MALKWLGLLFFIIIGLFVAIFFLGVPSFISRINTTYIKGYSPEKLDKVKEGMTEQEVAQIMGKPMFNHREDSNCSYYSTAKTELSDYIGWEAIAVCYSPENRVTGIGENIFYN